MRNKLKIPFLFFILIYFNQGFSGLASQCEYYLLREHWGLTASMIGIIGLITSLGWFIKPFWGFIIDKKPIFNYHSKYYLYISYFILILCFLYIIIFGFNILSFIILTLIINICISLNDVANDRVAVLLEKKYKLNGRVQSCQWMALGVAGLIVSILGAVLADKLSVDVGYRVAYAIMLIIPIITFIYLKYHYIEEKVKKISKLNWGFVFKEISNSRMICALLFIACFQLCPSFGTALMIKCREELGIGKMFLGYLSATGTVLGLIGYGLYYWKCFKFDMKKMLVFMIVFSAITNLFYLYIPNQWVLLSYNILFGAFSGITFLTLLAFFAKITPSGYEAMIYALITSVSNLCSRGGGFLGGVIYDNFGYSSTVIISSVFTLFCLVFIPFLKLKKEK
jgi:MFS family permease